jgi:hypothetical protein
MMGTSRLAPSLLVFGVVSRFPPMSIDLPKQRDRMAALAAAQMEMSAIVRENRITAALTHNVPSSVDRTYEVGAEVFEVFVRKKKMDGTDGCGTCGRQDYNNQRFGIRANFTVHHATDQTISSRFTFYRRR